jgi:hypothetical protein
MNSYAIAGRPTSRSPENRCDRLSWYTEDKNRIEGSDITIRLLDKFVLSFMSLAYFYLIVNFLTASTHFYVLKSCAIVINNDLWCQLTKCLLFS